MKLVEKTIIDLKDYLKQNNEPHSYEMWLKPLQFKIEGNEIIVVETSSDFARNLIKERYSDQIENVVRRTLSSKAIIKYLVSEGSPGVSKKIGSFKEKKTITNKPLLKKKKSSNYFEIEPNSDLKLSPKFTFDSFVPGKNNQLAYAAAQAVTGAPGQIYNPLFIYGKTGLGKTHLMQAVGHHIKQKDKKAKIVYVPCEEFVNLMIEAIQKGTTTQFRERFRKVDILMVDDIQFLAKKEQTQEEFFNTFNSLYHDHKQIVLTSDCQPKEMQHLQERLVSRFEWGLVTDVQPPTYETRVSILKMKSELSKLKVPADVIQFLSENIIDNVRQMEGALNRVYTFSRLVKQDLTVNLCQDILKDLIATQKSKRLTIDDIQNEVVHFYSISLSQLKGPKRLKSYALPRQIAMYITRKYTDHSFPEIGDAFGGRDHTTVLHACRSIERKIEVDTQLKIEIHSICQNLENI